MLYVLHDVIHVIMGSAIPKSLSVCTNNQCHYQLARRVLTEGEDVNWQKEKTFITMRGRMLSWVRKFLFAYVLWFFYDYLETALINFLNM